MEQQDKLSSEDKAVADLIEQLQTLKSIRAAVGASKFADQKQAASIVGQNILSEEIGFFGDWEGRTYKFDESTRDILLAHARQDIATTYCLSADIWEHVVHLRHQCHVVRNLCIVGIFLLLSNIFISLVVLNSIYDIFP